MRRSVLYCSHPQEQDKWKVPLALQPRSFNLAETGGVGFRARCSRKSYSQPRLCFIRGLTEPDRFFLFYLCFLLALSPFLAPESGGEFEEGDRFIFTEATSRPPYKRRAFS
jgi:hypothetical protein